MVYDTLFKLLKASLFTDEPVEVDNWKSVFTEMKAQTVAGLPAEWLKKHPIPGAAEWSAYCALQQGGWIRVMHGQKQLLELLDQHNIPCVILKGAAAAMYYPHPTLRSMGDVDFLVNREDLERAAEVLETNGYNLTHAKNDKHHHYGYAKGGISFELHWRLGIVNENDKALVHFFEEGIENREWRDIDGFRFPVLPPVLNGMVLLFHINQHLRGGLGLRQIIDWMLYVSKVSPAQWSELREQLHMVGLEKLALTVTAMCEKYLGLSQPFPLYESADIDETVVDSLMEMILVKGNFGVKAGVEGKTEGFFTSSKSLRGVYSRLQSGGLSNWKAVIKHPYLRPFAWIYQAFRILGIFIKNKMTPKRFAEQRRKGLEQRKLLDQLGLSVDRTIH